MEEVVSSGGLATCRECLEEFDDLPYGICDECNREECPTCEGTGLNPDGDEDTDSDCPDCDGDGVI